MKKLLLMLTLMLMPILVIANDASPFSEGIYQMEVSISGQMAPGQDSGSASTKQVINGMSFQGYTVAYTAMVDAIREILSRVWALENVEGGIPEQKLQELIADPRVLYTQ